MRPGPRGLPLLVLLLLLIAFDNCTATIMLARGGGVGYRVVGYCCASVRTTATAHRSSRGLAFLAARPSHPRQALLLGSSRGRGRGAASRLSASTPSSELPRLDLVFDINKTILLEDPAGGKGVRALLNEIVAELAWGRVTANGDGGGDPRWVSAGLPLAIDPPPSPPALVSYSFFVHQQHPDVAGGDLKAVKARRDGLKGSFTEPGGPGQAYAGEVAELDAALGLSAPDPTTTTNLDPQLLAAAGLAGRERVVLLPAFLHFLLRLQDTYPLDLVALQFRTFGDDLPRVSREFNALCRGAHPLFPGRAFGGSDQGDGGRDFALDLEGDPECFGCMYRDAEGPVMVLGTWEAPASRAEVARLQGRGLRVLESVQEMHAFVRQKQASARPTLAVRDYWPWWRQNLEEGTAGKLVLVDDAALTVALDDNIERTRSHIIDLREGLTGRAVPFGEGAAAGQLVRAEPYLALKDPKGYFWGVLQECLARWRRTRACGDGREGGAAGTAAGA